MSISWYKHSSIKIGSSQLPLSFENKSLLTNPHQALSSLGASKLAVISQVHACNVLEFSYQELLSICSAPVNILGEADAIIISGLSSSIDPANSLAVGIRTADCLPIVLHSGQTIALLHAGWRGLAAGIIEQVFAKFQSIVRNQEERCWFIGPAAKDCCYEVEGDVLLACGISNKKGEQVRKIDLQLLAESRIRTLSNQSRIEIDQRCTICSPGLHSYRRSKTTLRNLMFVVL